MPILDVGQGEDGMVIKRSMNPGFAGIDNELYYMDKTLMLFGDAKAVVGRAREAVFEVDGLLTTRSPLRMRRTGCSAFRGRAPARLPGGIMDLDRDVDEADARGKPLTVLLGRERTIRDHGDHSGMDAGAYAPDVEVRHAVPLTALDASFTACRIGSCACRSRRTRAVSRTRPTAQWATRTAPTMPMAGSIQLRPKKRPARRDRIASTEVKASASTWR